MKRGKKLTGIAAFLAAVGLVFASCGDGGGGGGGHSHNWGWASYITGSGLRECQTGGCTAKAGVGDTGPEGGKIIYAAASGFTVTGAGSFTACYIEAAPTNQGTSLAWASESFTSTGINGTESSIGTGKENTRLILAKDANAPAAKAAKVTIGGKSDWFLPSSAELTQMYKAKTHLGISSGVFWSSTQAASSNALCSDFGPNFIAEGPVLKGLVTYLERGGINVRAVRYF